MRDGAERAAIPTMMVAFAFITKGLPEPPASRQMAIIGYVPGGRGFRARGRVPARTCKGEVVGHDGEISGCAGPDRRAGPGGGAGRGAGGGGLSGQPAL